MCFGRSGFEKETSNGLVTAAAGDMKSGVAIRIDNINITILFQKRLCKKKKNHLYSASWVHGS